MERAIEHLQHELANLRTGRATPGMLDHLKADVYGEKLPLKAVGSVSVRDAQLLVVTLFDPATVEAVVAAIAHSPLRLTPRAEGQEVLVPVPQPTAETLAALAKVCRSEGEAAKVSMRHVRKGAMEAARGAASEDERRRLEKEVQAVTDKYVAEADRLVEAKQADITAHNS
jgi:ribosome recycling factor